ncbi:class I SAM-dependent methyltransferase [Paucihalobacter sp.]|uniref:class I SAM-dependent methyltransferase n=1 Tax=Paucihalobacter sp. TaxID=2850405 RepID=UPI002FE3DD04
MSQKYLNPSSFKVKDFSVSGEEFTLVFDEEFEYFKTTPQPCEDQLPAYYKSEDYISHTDAKRNTLEKLYHFIKEIALRQKVNLINALKTDSKLLLDIGCGTGDFLKTAADNKWQVLGIEPNQQARSIANKKTNNSVFNIDKFDHLKDHSFDVITLWHVLEHLPNLDQQILNLKRLLKPNGAIVIAVPNYKSYDAQVYKSFWAAYDVPRHLWHFSQASISKLFQQHNMIVVQKKPLYFDAFYVSLLSEKYQSGRYRYLKAFWVGLRSNFKAMRSGEFSSRIYIVKKCKN